MKSVYKILLQDHHYLEVYFFRIYRFYDFIERYSSLTNIKVLIRYFLSVRNFLNRFSSNSCGSSLGVETSIIFFSDLMSLGWLEYLDLLSSVYNSNIVWFCIFCLSSTWKEAFFALPLLLAPFASLFLNWSKSSCKVSIIGLISCLKFSFFYKFCGLILVL